MVKKRAIQCPHVIGECWIEVMGEEEETVLCECKALQSHKATGGCLHQGGPDDRGCVFLIQSQCPFERAEKIVPLAEFLPQNKIKEFRMSR